MPWPSRATSYDAAIEAYADGSRIADIKAAGVDPRTLRRLLRRAMRPHADGSIWRWRAVLPRRASQELRAAVRAQGSCAWQGGNAGAFFQLLERFPELK